MDSELDISALFHPGIDQDQTPVLLESITMNWRTKCIQKDCNHHTVRAPQICSTMHNENTIETAIVQSINDYPKRQYITTDIVFAGI